jgi:hypothetical protein
MAMAIPSASGHAADAGAANGERGGTKAVMTWKLGGGLKYMRHDTQRGNRLAWLGIEF